MSRVSRPWRGLFSRLGRPIRNRDSASLRFTSRRMCIETLESRVVLSATSTAVMMGQEFELPSWISVEEAEEVQRLAAEITRTGEDTPIYVDSTQSYSLIGVDDYYDDGLLSGYDGSGYSMAILDTGADLDHPSFGPDNDNDGISDRIVYQYDFADNDTNANDVNGHGTNVAGIAAGIATGADIIVLKVFRDSGSGSFGDVEDALQWVTANAATYNIAAVNMSLGDSGNYSSYRTGTLTDEINTLDALGITTVVSSGNDFFTVGSTPGVAYPAAEQRALSVGATWDSNGGQTNWSSGATDFSRAPDRIVSFSQRHSTLSDIFAPGAFITSAGLNGGTVSYGGTSQAAPHVTGAVTLLQQISDSVTGDRLGFDELVDLLQDTGVSIVDGDDEDDNVTNTGLTFERLDLLAAAEEVAGSTGGQDAPQVTGVTITGPNPNDGVNGTYAIPTGSGSQIRTVPVGGADIIEVSFSKEMNPFLLVNGFSLVGAFTSTNYTSDFSYQGFDSLTNTATWEYTPSIANDMIPSDQMVLTISDSVQDLGGLALDGEWTNPLSTSSSGTSVFPSGNGSESGDFQFYFTILQGDATRDNVIDGFDVNRLALHYGGSQKSFIEADATGEGSVTGHDINVLAPFYEKVDFSTWPTQRIVTNGEDSDSSTPVVSATDAAFAAMAVAQQDDADEDDQLRAGRHGWRGQRFVRSF